MWRPAILQKAEAALLDEKASKLIGLARVLDQLLGEGFDAQLADPGLPDAERVEALARALRPVTDDLAAAFPAVGLGYFDARTDRIVAYAPSATLGALVGVAPPADHLGRIAMQERVDKLAVGSMVRGDAMNCMHPLIRGGEVIGFTFANESLADIYRQMHAGSGRSYFERAERLALAGELATAIAHEIRNPLTVVAGSIQLIPERLHDEEFLRSLSEIAGRELARVNRTIQGLLGFARYSEPQRQRLDLNEVVEQAVEFIRWYAANAGIEIDLALSPRPLRVYGDGEHLQQALLNLMMNGIQAMGGSGGGGRLAIRLDHPGGSRFARIAVQDQGPGIAPDLLPKIWEVFYSSKPGGTGLGLPVVQRIVDEHRGQVAVESAPGQGTCFTVLLPLTTGTDVAGEE